MKDFEKFEAFKLDKVQMNAIAGGSIYCQSSWGDKNIVFSDNISMNDAQASADLAFGETAICEEEI